MDDNFQMNGGRSIATAESLLLPSDAWPRSTKWRDYDDDDHDKRAERNPSQAKKSRSSGTKRSTGSRAASIFPIDSVKAEPTDEYSDVG